MLRASFEPSSGGRGLPGQRDGPALPALPSAGPTKPRTGNLIELSNNASLPRPSAKPHGVRCEDAHSCRLWIIRLHRGLELDTRQAADAGSPHDRLSALGGNPGGGGKLNDLSAH